VHILGKYTFPLWKIDGGLDMPLLKVSEKEETKCPSYP
jgi:hypothetical protein